MGLVFSTPAQAAEPPEGEPQGEITRLKERIKELEESQAELYHTLEEKKEPGLMRELIDRLTFGGLVEVEAAVDENDKDGDTSDVTLATVELMFDARVHDRVTTHVLFLWEEDDTEPVELDEGTISLILLDMPDRTLSLVGGKMYIPFGVFKSHFVSDPLVLELGETNQSTVELVYDSEMVEAAVGAFNGSVNETGDDDKVDEWYASLTVSPAEPVVAGAYYLSDIAETNLEVLGSGPVAETKGGWGAFVIFGWRGIKVDAEYVSAVERFSQAVLDADSDGRGDKPSAFNIEVAYDITDWIEVAAKYEGTDDLPDLPEEQYGVAASFGVYENVAVTVEYLHGEFSGAGGERDLGTAQLAVEF